mmetsp:Transcript_18259/g.16550  ORF Transcript_18259/g.16550 Transcript_18259/m.16550 type:complete len:661 (+) Transcript_18259:61-2043(+)
MLVLLLLNVLVILNTVICMKFTWENVLSNVFITSVDTSDDGQIIAAAEYDGALYVSQDQGTTWSITLDAAEEGSWQTVTVSSTGKYMYAVAYEGGLYSSSNYGGNWTLSFPVVELFTDVATDSSGQYVAACIQNDVIYLSDDYGETGFPTIFPQTYWSAVSISSNGSIIVASSIRYLYISYDYGISVSEISSVPGDAFIDIAISSTGKAMYAIDYNTTFLYASFDYGRTWTVNSDNSLGYSIDTSANGLTLVSSDLGLEDLLVSVDYAGTFTTQGISGADGFYDVAVDASGTYYAAGTGQGVFIGYVLNDVPDYCKPSVAPTHAPTRRPTRSPTAVPTKLPSARPSSVPTEIPTATPTTSPTPTPTAVPTPQPSTNPTNQPTPQPSNPTLSPTVIPTVSPTSAPTTTPTASPTSVPTKLPTFAPTTLPTTLPTFSPTTSPTSYPTIDPTTSPTNYPSNNPTNDPTNFPTSNPSTNPSTIPTSSPTVYPSSSPTKFPTTKPTTRPTRLPTVYPTKLPSLSPTISPTRTLATLNYYNQYLDRLRIKFDVILRTSSIYGDNYCIDIPTAFAFTSTYYQASISDTTSSNWISDLEIYFQPTSEYIGSDYIGFASNQLAGWPGSFSGSSITPRNSGKQSISISSGFNQVCFANNCNGDCSSRITI